MFMKKINWLQIGSKVAEMRRSRNMTQQQLAELTGLSDVYIGYLEQGKRHGTMDAGFNYYGGWRDAQAKQNMAAMPITILSIHGNHEMRPSRIPTYSLKKWHGGYVFAEEA